MEEDDGDKIDIAVSELAGRRSKYVEDEENVGEELTLYTSEVSQDDDLENDPYGPTYFPPRKSHSHKSNATKKLICFASMGLILLILVIVGITVSLFFNDHQPNITNTAKNTTTTHKSNKYSREEALKLGLKSLDAEEIRATTKFLSDDLLEGRGTGTLGEQITVKYIASRLEALGYDVKFQPVPLFGSKPINGTSLTIKNSDTSNNIEGNIDLKFPNEFVCGTEVDNIPHILEDCEWIFVGYGIYAPDDYQWDDYGSLDVSGKCLLGLVNDPPKFQGDALTYYGRWTYKYEEANRRKAKVMYLIHTEESAGYPWDVVQNGWTNEHVTLINPNSNATNKMLMQGWITKQSAQRIAEKCKTTLDSWISAAKVSTFKAYPLNLLISSQANYSFRYFNGTNVIGFLKGKKPDRIVLTAHHDHLGIDTSDPKNPLIYHGAIDNASGVGVLLAVARALSVIHAVHSIERSIHVVSITAEEKGLLGSQYYVEHALNNMIANINFDEINVWGVTKDLVGIGSDKSDELKEIFTECATKEHMTISPDPNPNQGSYFRSDQLSFARGGVVGLAMDNGCQFVEGGEEFCHQKWDQYNIHDYHRPSDVYFDKMKFDGAIQVARVGVRMAFELIIDSSKAPTFNADSGFVSRNITN